MLIGISGKIGSGKDTLADMFKLAAPGLNFEVRKYAGKLKEVASLISGIPIEKFEDQEFKKTFLSSDWDVYHTQYLYDPYIDQQVPMSINQQMTVRDFLQKLGTDAMRNGLHQNTWINATYADYTPDKNWIITDVRFLNEARSIQNRNGILIRINRVTDNAVGTAHISETALDDFNDWDYVIDNNYGLEDLRIHAEYILKKHLILP